MCSEAVDHAFYGHGPAITATEILIKGPPRIYDIDSGQLLWEDASAA